MTKPDVFVVDVEYTEDGEKKNLCIPCDTVDGALATFRDVVGALLRAPDIDVYTAKLQPGRTGWLTNTGRMTKPRKSTDKEIG